MKSRSFRSFLLAGSLVPLAGVTLSQDASAQAIAPRAPLLVASVHARNVDATLGVLRGYLPIPIKPEGLLPEFVGDFGKLVALGAPVDLAVSLDPQAGENFEKPLWAFSVGVGSLDEAQKLAQSRKMLDGPGRPEALRVTTSSGRTLFCLLGPSPKGAGAPGSGRLACSNQDRDRDELAPYLLRLSPPPAAQGSDVHAELLVETLARTYQGPWQRVLQLGGMAIPQKLKLGQPTFDRALTDATQALLGQLKAISEDLHTVALDVAVQPTGAEVRLGYRMAGQHSLWAQSDAESAARPPVPPPPVFFSLPGDVTSGSYRTANPRWMQQLVQLLAPLVDGFLEHDGLAAADRQAINDLFTKLPKFEGPMTTVLGEGPRDGGPPAPATSGDVTSAMDVLSSGSFYLATVEPPERDQSLAWLRALVATYNRPAVQAYFKKKWKQLDPTGTLPTLKAEAPPKQLGADAYGVVFSGNLAGLLAKSGAKGAPVAKAPKPAPVVLHLLVARAGGAAGGRLWTAFGADRPTLLRRLTQAVQPPPDAAAKSLLSRQGLEGLREPGQQSAGFLTLAGLSRLIDVALAASRRGSTEALSKDKGGAKAAEPLRAAQLLNAIPHHGEVPMLYGSRAARPNPLALTQEMYLRIPKTVVEDLIALAMNLAAERN